MKLVSIKLENRNNTSNVTDSKHSSLLADPRWRGGKRKQLRQLGQNVISVLQISDEKSKYSMGLIIIKHKFLRRHNMESNSRVGVEKYCPHYKKLHNRKML